jgi:recombinational DNA repair protein (RecF pathway)
MTEQLKECCHCRKKLPLDAYYIKSTRRLSADCKPCHRSKAALNRRITYKIKLESRQLDFALYRDFITQHILVPTIWELTLCH